MEKILNEIRAERSRQDAKFGEQNHSPIEFMAILAEEIGEANKEIVDAHFGFAPKEKCLEQARTEFIQVAAMAYQCGEAVSRREKIDCVFHKQGFFDEMEKEIAELTSVDGTGEGTAKLIFILATIGKAYGDACAVAIYDLDSDLKTKQLSNYIGNMSFIITLASACVHYIDTIWLIRTKNMSHG